MSSRRADLLCPALLVGLIASDLPLHGWGFLAGAAGAWLLLFLGQTLLIEFQRRQERQSDSSRTSMFWSVTPLEVGPPTSGLASKARMGDH